MANGLLIVEPFKNNLDEKAIVTMAHHLGRVAPNFNQAGFVDLATKGLDDLALKERSARLTKTLGEFLPKDFSEAVNILVESLDSAKGVPFAEAMNEKTANGIRGWPIMAMADFVALHGQDHIDLSLETLREMTSRFSSEFAIRPFLQQRPEATLQTLSRWVTDESKHVRRLVSEGTRPRLPWGMQLRAFMADPEPVIALLERLKDDNSEYVRRSVANNLNDIAKDHPKRIVALASDWMKDASLERQRLVRHGLRSLIKAGDKGALNVLGYGPAKVQLSRFEVLTPDVLLGDGVEFSLELRSTGNRDQPLIVDYVIHHRRANGQTTPKVFKWKTITLKSGQSLSATRRHAIKPITTRKYYAGGHGVEININGETLCRAEFELRLA